MKKLLLVMAIGAFVACNDNAGTEGTNSDSAVIVPTTVDTNTVAPIDTTMRSGDTTGLSADTTAR